MTTEPMSTDVAGSAPVAPPPQHPHTHPYDLGTALAGVVFAGAGVVFILGRLEVIEVQQAVVLPSVIVGLGAALVLGSIQRHRGE